MSIEDKAAEIARGLTRIERDVLLHTTGQNQHPPQDRNYFCAGEDSEDDLALAKLATIGVAECYSGPREHMPYNMYRATPLGLAVASHLKDPRS